MMRPVRLTVSPSLMLGELAEEHRAHAVLFQIQRDAEDPARKLEHLARHDALDPVHTRNPVPNRDDGADLGHVHVDVVRADLVANDLGDFVGFDIHEFES